jgi:hypothetical protein
LSPAVPSRPRIMMTQYWRSFVHFVDYRGWPRRMWHSKRDSEHRRPDSFASQEGDV